MPPANSVFSAMVTCSVGVQTSCPNSPTYSHICVDSIEDICPSHFTDIHITKLEDTFSRKQKPDDIQLQIIAMECNLLYKDVRDWFKARRIKWIEDLVRNENNAILYKSDSNNNNTAVYSKKLNSHKHNSMDLKNSKKAIVAAPSRGTTT